MSRFFKRLYRDLALSYYIQKTNFGTTLFLDQFNADSWCHVTPRAEGNLQIFERWKLAYFLLVYLKLKGEFHREFPELRIQVIKQAQLVHKQDQGLAPRAKL